MEETLSSALCYFFTPNLHACSVAEEQWLVSHTGGHLKHHVPTCIEDSMQTTRFVHAMEVRWFRNHAKDQSDSRRTCTV